MLGSAGTNTIGRKKPTRGSVSRLGVTGRGRSRPKGTSKDTDGDGIKVVNDQVGKGLEE